MAELVTGALIGWFGNRIFGPSVDALGENLKAHLQSRLPAIFGRAEQIAKAKNVEPQPIKSGLLARMIVDAWFSEDTPEITDWWANLFVSASHQGDNRHAAFSDMMAMVGPKEASVLTELITPFEKDGFRLCSMLDHSFNADLIRETRILDLLGDSSPFRIGQIDRMVEQIHSGNAGWPFRLRAWKLYVQRGWDNAGIEFQGDDWFETNQMQCSILQKAGILDFGRVDVPVMGQPCWVDTVEVTRLGLEFFLECTGKRVEGLG